jgi:hypothetical protein
MNKLKLTDKLLIMIILVLIINLFNQYQEKKHIKEVEHQKFRNEILMHYVKTISR